jgi:hypothetical protein
MKKLLITLIVCSLASIALGQGTIKTIRATDTTAYATVQIGNYQSVFPVDITKVPEDHAAVWSGAISYLGSSVLEDGESYTAVFIQPIRTNAVVTATETQIIEGEEVEVPTAWRDEIPVIVSVAHADGIRKVRTSSEVLPEQLRDNLILMIKAMSIRTKEEWESLAPDTEA